MVPPAAIAGLLGAAVVLASCGDARPRSCAETQAYLERDTCWFHEMATVPASEPEKVLEIAARMQDPMIRGAAVAQWVEEHANQVPAAQGRRVCDLLDGRDRSVCLRRLSSPHLLR